MDERPIKDWEEQERPREKLMALGAKALSDAELLAILIGSGSHEESAVALMKRILSHYNGRLTHIGRSSVLELCQFKGIGSAKAITLLAASELAIRQIKESKPRSCKYDNSQCIYEYFHENMRERDIEECWIMLLNQSLGFIRGCQISKGGISQSLVDIRIILREAILSSATSIVLCHNHPSGSLKPSGQDDKITERLRKASETMNIRLLDHLIISEQGYYSYADEGRL